MEFKFKAVDQQPPFRQPFRQQPTSSSSGSGYFTQQAIRAGYRIPGFGPGNEYFNPGFRPANDYFGNPIDEIIARELEKERIREEIIAAEIARRQAREDELCLQRASVNRKMEFKFRAVDQQPPFRQPFRQQPTSSSSGSFYFTQQAIRAGFGPGNEYFNPGFRPANDYFGNPINEIIARELEKERIREEIIAAEIARRQAREDEARRVLSNRKN